MGLMQVSVLNQNLIEDAKNENTNNDATTEKANLNSKRESDITIEIKEDNASKVSVKDAKKENNTYDSEKTEEEPTDNFDSNSYAKIIEENEDDEKSMKSTITSESTNVDTSTSSDQVNLNFLWVK